MLTGCDDNITIKKNNMTIEFNEKIYTRKFILFGIKIVQANDFCGGTQDISPVKMSVKDAHDKLGHISFSTTTKLQTKWDGYLQVIPMFARHVLKLKPVKRTSWSEPQN
jgi:hypothetical protein